MLSVMWIHTALSHPRPLPSTHQVSLDLGHVLANHGNASSSAPSPVGVLHLELMDERSHMLGGGMPLILMPTAGNFHTILG